jgi:hypothetical protein
VTEQDSELQLNKDSEESGPDLWYEESLGNLDIPKISSEENPSTQEEAQDLSNQTSSSTQIIPSPRPTYNPWTNEQRYEACVAYVLYGKVDKVVEITGVPRRTVYTWINSNWWPGMLDKAKREHQELIEARLSDIVEKATAELIDRLKYGDDVYDSKKGITVKVPIRAKELNLIIANLTDRLRTIRNQPNRLTAEIKFDPVKAAREFAAIAAENRDKIVSDQ